MSDASTSDTSMAAQHPTLPERTRLTLATTEGEELNTIRVPLVPVACWRLNDPAFAFDSSFVSANFRGEIAILRGVVAANPGCPAALFGHCDPAGDDALNKTLGDRRAIAIYALLTHQPSLWAHLYDNPQVGDTWGTLTVQAVLGDLRDGAGNPYYAGSIDGQYGPATTDAVKRFQGDHGLSVDGDAGKDTRKALFDEYMSFLCTPEGAANAEPFRMQVSDFLGGTDAQPGDLPKMSLQSCGKFNPIVLLTSAEMKGEDQATRNADDAPNRRVIMFFFPQGTTVDASMWPCPKVKESNAACKAAFWPDGDARRKNGDELREYKKTRDTMACRFFDRFARRSPCEGSPPVFIPLVIRLVTLDHEPLAGMDYTLSVGALKLPGTTTNDGLIVQRISASATTATLEYDGLTRKLDIAPMDEPSTPAGAQPRLSNLGFGSADVQEGVLDEETKLVLMRFQNRHDLPISGQLDDPTSSKLKDRYGS